MFEFFVILLIASGGSLVRLSANVALKLVDQRTKGETLTAEAGRGWSAPAQPSTDSAFRFGFILSCYGAIVLALVSVLPGALALERTGLAFALLCVGGLIGEICGTGSTIQLPGSETSEEATSAQPASRSLSVALTLVLNLGIAVLSANQGLVEIVPRQAVSSSLIQELDPVIVVAHRNIDLSDEHAGL